jgi:hypothetical protein
VIKKVKEHKKKVKKEAKKLKKAGIQPKSKTNLKNLLTLIFRIQKGLTNSKSVPIQSRNDRENGA